MSAESTIEIDLAGVPDAVEMHERIAAALRFPDYYGQNWDAFDECMIDLDHPPKKIRIRGFEHLVATLPREAESLKACFKYFLDSPKGADVILEIV